jgi:hypothetical protein
MTLRPRQTAHRGSVLAAAFVVDTRLVPEHAARMRLLDAAGIGIAASRVGPYLIARVGTAMRVDCATSPGVPLVRFGSLLCSSPLDADELARLRHQGDAIVFVEGGAAGVWAKRDEVDEDVATWIDVSAFSSVVDCWPLGAVVSVPRAQAVSVAPGVRTSFGLRAVSTDAAGVMEAMTRRADVTRAPSTMGPVLGALARFASSVLGSSSSSSSSSSLSAPPPRSWLDKFAERAARVTRWEKWIGRSHADYVHRMMTMFDDNNLDDALRHAIPLNGDVASSLSKSMPLRTLGARDNFAIVPGRVAASS